MDSIWESKGRRLNNRVVEVSCWDCDGDRIVVEGVLRDVRFQESYMITGEVLPVGDVHHQRIRLLVNLAGLIIEDIDVELMHMPREVCMETADCLAQLKGLTIARGFTSKVKKLVGGSAGCAHLVELLQAMAPAIFQGLDAHQSQTPSHLDPEQAEKRFQALVNTCHGWAENGPLVAMVKERVAAASH